ncbi:hypothetical protein ACFQ1S_33665 [Kibdelosporangium lantanae]|uniref:Uncharacterized protein n=1 Tax=Kibdelosporangium lantanae TaxID=1497396 RepID=A0ABW3MHE7_9PSEU
MGHHHHHPHDHDHHHEELPEVLDTDVPDSELAPEDVSRSVVQLVLGTYMVWDARRQRLCQRYFDQPDARVAVE